MKGYVNQNHLLYIVCDNEKFKIGKANALPKKRGFMDYINLPINNKKSWIIECATCQIQNNLEIIFQCRCQSYRFWNEKPANFYGWKEFYELSGYYEVKLLMDNIKKHDNEKLKIHPYKTFENQAKSSFKKFSKLKESDRHADRHFNFEKSVRLFNYIFSITDEDIKL